MKKIITKIEVAIARFVTAPGVQSVVRHAVIAAAAVLFAAFEVGGFPAITVAVVVAAGAAALRVISLAIVAYIKGGLA